MRSIVAAVTGLALFAMPVIASAHPRFSRERVWVRPAVPVVVAPIPAPVNAPPVVVAAPYEWPHRVFYGPRVFRPYIWR